MPLLVILDVSMPPNPPNPTTEGAFSTTLIAFCFLRARLPALVALKPPALIPLIKLTLVAAVELLVVENTAEEVVVPFDCTVLFRERPGLPSSIGSHCDLRLLNEFSGIAADRGLSLALSLSRGKGPVSEFSGSISYESEGQFESWNLRNF